MIHKLLYFLTLCLVFLFLIPKSAIAAPNFTTEYVVTYTINEEGMTHAKLQGTLINTSSQYYASSYKMQVGFSNITNVKAADSGGEIKPTTIKSENGTTIGLNFNTKAVGKGSKLPFTITFDTKEVAKKYGKVWEINIPGISNPNEFSKFTVTVEVPKSFGNPSYIKPALPDKSLIFTKEQLNKSGISITFGDKQVYSFSLKYHLKNDNVYPIRTEIALPPATNYQEVHITDITPEPTNVKEDADGNWLAEYHLKPAEKKEIIATGLISVRLVPSEQILSQEKYEEYLKEKPYWETSKKDIRDIAQRLKTPKAIYDFVVANLQYDFTRVTEEKPRLGAENTLKNPSSAACREFTDLFIALARAAGIPAREVDGFAYTENVKQRPLSLTKDIIHAWPEYYDQAKKTWIMVDPTWGNTTGGIDYFDVLDLDHVVFAIKGNDSNFPVPAGGYKTADSTDGKNIVMSFAETEPVKTPNANITTSFPEIAIAGLPITGTITLKNTGATKIASQVFFVESTNLQPDQQVIAASAIPPFGSQTWNVKFKPANFLTNTNASFTTRFAPDSELEGRTNETFIKISPFFLTSWGIGICIGLIVFVLIITIAIKLKRKRF